MKTLRAITRRGARRQSGFTLAELMIGMVLGLFIVLALITLLVNVNRNNSELAKSNRVIENGRLALQLLQTDVSHAGYLAGFVPNFDDLTYTSAPTLASAGGQIPTAVPDPCVAYDPATWTSEYKANLLGIAAAAYQVGSSGSAPVCSSVVTSPKALTDVLVVRHLEGCEAGGGGGTNECADTTAASNPDVYFQMSRCSTDTTPTVFATSGWTLKKRDCTAIAPIRRFASTLYYIRTYANTTSDGIPTLMRSSFAASGSSAPQHLAAQPLIEGVEGFHVEFGLDNKSDTGADVDFTTAPNFAVTTPAMTSPTNRGDGNPDTYVSCTTASPCTATTLATGLVNAVTAKIYVLMRSESRTPGHTDTKTYNLGSQTMGPFNDQYKRHVFTQTIRFNNVSGRRETP